MRVEPGTVAVIFCRLLSWNGSKKQSSLIRPRLSSSRKWFFLFQYLCNTYVCSQSLPQLLIMVATLCLNSYISQVLAFLLTECRSHNFTLPYHTHINPHPHIPLLLAFLPLGWFYLKLFRSYAVFSLYDH